MKSLSERFRDEAEAYADLLTLCEKRVVRWEYTCGEMWSEDPASHLLAPSQRSSAHVVNSALEASHKYGFDEKGRVIISLASGYVITREPREPRFAVFIRYEDGFAEISRFYKKRLNGVSRYLISDGRIVEHQWYHSREETVGRGTFEWVDDTLVSYRVLHGDTADEWTFDNQGKETGHFRIRPDGTRVQLDLPLPKGVTMKSLAEQIQNRLVQRIVEVVEKASISEPAYCLALAYDGEGNPPLPPCIGIGLDSERQKWIGELGPDAKSMVWNPAEFKHYEKENTQLPDDEELEQACEWFNVQLEKRETHAPARKLLNAVAAELNTKNWRGVLKTTDDFVVYATDFEMSDLNGNLKKTVTPKLFAQFKAAKML